MRTARLADRWWRLGQTGFVVKSQGGTLIVIDPYLSNSAKAIGEPLGLNLDRLVPPPLAPRDLVGVDLYAMTHSHGDHLDPETLAGYRAAGGAGPYLAPAETAGESFGRRSVPAGRHLDDLAEQSLHGWDLEIRATFAIPFSGDYLGRTWATRSSQWKEAAAFISRAIRPITNCWRSPSARTSPMYLSP